MEHQLQVTHGENHHAHGAHDDFLVRFRQNLWKEIRSFLYWFFFVFYSVLGTFFRGTFDWMLTFSEVRIFLGVLVPPFAIYFFGKYLTLIPMFFVVLLACVPLKRAGGVLVLAMVVSFFIVFLM
jgi:hypothetical protein